MCADRQVRKNLLRSSQSWFCNIQMHFRHMWLFLLFAQVMLAYTLELGGHSILCPPCPNPKFKMKTLPQDCATFDFQNWSDRCPFCQKSTRENRARGNRKTLKWLKMTTKSNFRTLKLKSHEEYLIYRTYFV